MADGGFVVKFDGKTAARCFAVSFDYDGWEYTVNENDTRPLPKKVKSIAVVVETG